MPLVRSFHHISFVPFAWVNISQVAGQPLNISFVTSNISFVIITSMKHLICIVFVRQHLICSLDMMWTSHLILWRIRTSHMLSFRIGNISNGMFPIKSISYVLSWNFGHLTCSFFQNQTSHLYWNAKNTSQMVVFALWTSHMMRSAGMNISFVINPIKICVGGPCLHRFSDSGKSV